MASLGIRCGGKHPAAFILQPPSFPSNCQISPLSNSLLSNFRFRKPSSQGISASVASPPPFLSPFFHNLDFPFPPSSEPINEENSVKSQEKEAGFSDQLDVWMRDSVAEIVKNLKQAPLLVHIYAYNNLSGLMEVKTDKGFAENWRTLNQEWSNGEKKSPDGIILVEELVDKDNNTDFEEAAAAAAEEGTKAWGVVIQGKGVEKGRGPACYLLKTCRVNSGLGLFGTHFCLVRVKSFRETAFTQLKNSWLLH